MIFKALKKLGNIFGKKNKVENEVMEVREERSSKDINDLQDTGNDILPTITIFIILSSIGYRLFKKHSENRRSRNQSFIPLPAPWFQNLSNQKNQGATTTSLISLSTPSSSTMSRSRLISLKEASNVRSDDGINVDRGVSSNYRGFEEGCDSGAGSVLNAPTVGLTFTPTSSAHASTALRIVEGELDPAS